MSKTTFLIVLCLVFSKAFAGGATGGSTEVTQIINMAQLIQQYATQLDQYQTQLHQYATMTRNLEANPAGVSLQNLSLLATNASRLLTYGKDIGSSIARVDQNFANTFKSTQAQTFADKFSKWTSASQEGLKAAMLNAGLQREQFSDDATALQALTSNLASSQGNLSALQALGSLNARQIQESMKLRDLISQQQVAQNNFLAAQASKDQLKTETTAIQFQATPLPDKSKYASPKL